MPGFTDAFPLRPAPGEFFNAFSHGQLAMERHAIEGRRASNVEI